MDRRARQLFYMRRAWRGLRDQVLRAEPFCRRCREEDGKLVPAKQVDHIVSIDDDPTRALDPENLQPLCTPCHSAKTLAEVTGRPVRRRRQKIWGVNSDGTPRDPEHAWNRERGPRST